MIMFSLTVDPTPLYRVRDGIYAADLLITAVTKLDLFSWLDGRGAVRTVDLVVELALAERPADVLLTYCAALGLIERDMKDGDRITITELARQHLVSGSTFDLRAYYGSLAERPAVAELERVLHTDGQAAWAGAHPRTDPPDDDSVGSTADWSARLADATFASQITAAMDARSAFLAPALARVVEDLPLVANRTHRHRQPGRIRKHHLQTHSRRPRCPPRPQTR